MRSNPLTPMLLVLAAGLLACEAEKGWGSYEPPGKQEPAGDETQPAPPGGDETPGDPADPGPGDPADPGPGDPPGDDPGTDDPPGDTPVPPPPDGRAPGSACSCDADCVAVGGQAGICVFGVCMVRASGTCASAGSAAECPAHLRCWGISGRAGSVCWPDCDSFTCAGECDADGSCVMAAGMDCNSSCGSYCTGGAPPAGGTVPIGGACAGDGDCADAGATCYPEVRSGSPTGYVGGYCMIFGCPTPGAACGTGGSCAAEMASDGSNICMLPCGAGCRAGYVCSSGYCLAGCEGSASCPAGYACDGGICRAGACTPGSCPAGQECVDGVCRDAGDPGFGDGPGPYRGMSCTLPPLTCTGGESYCGQLVQFSPTEGAGYIDYPENGETASNQYRSWLRRDVVMLIQYATAKVACLASGWPSGNGAKLGLIDMSERTGAIPGTSVGSPGHPAGTHENGFDIDVAYYQEGVPDNRARPICEHTSSGSDAYHCTAAPTILDEWRTALFVGALSEYPYLRVIGCDGRAGPVIDGAFGTLCRDGWITPAACGARKLTYETTDTGRGWYYFHHHHLHVSASSSTRAMPDWADPCIDRSCDGAAIAAFYKDAGAL